MHSVEPVLPLSLQELKRKQQELGLLQQELMDRELEWSTVQREVHLFEEQYQGRVGEKHQELDRLKASVLALASKVFPEDGRIKNQARSAWEAMHPTKGSETGSAADLSTSKPIPEPTAELKKLFREAARHMHPDLTTDSGERARRNDLMAQLNQAYRESDVDRVRDLMEKYDAQQPVEGQENLGRKLSCVLKQMGQVRHRLFQIETEFKALEQSDMFRLHTYHKQQMESGVDVLADMACEVNEEIQALHNRIMNLASDCARL